MDDDIIRILVATDNHLGYAERDSIRSNDSFAAFEEVLITAKEEKNDFVLLAGDMFHENKPSRRTTHTAMSLLRRYCLGDEPVYTEILSQQSEVFKTSPLGRVNYEDPHQSVSLPVFAIHGNHDDPSREGGAGESLAALDLLSVSNLINYFGKSEQVDDIEIIPILMRKGTTFIALYGLGAVRDERLNRMWNQKKVKFVRPNEEQGKENFVNIFVLHQNRDYGRGSKNCVHESMIPQWMDVVIWGNEHECQPRLSESLVGTYRIYQPGSSVCTSLVEGESLLHPKGMGMLEIRLKKFRLLSIPFTQIRPFVYGDISLHNIQGLDPSDPKVEEKINAVLAKRVLEMIEEAREKSAGVEEAFPDQLQYRVLSPSQVLVRLRVEHAGFPAVNPQRFGSQFVGDVANPSELLLFAKKKKEDPRAVEGGKRPDASASEILQIIQEGEEDAIFKINIEDLVNETLSGGNRSLSVLLETEMALALEDFVVRRHVNAISDIVQQSLERLQEDLLRDKDATGKSGIAEAAGRAKKKAEDSMRKGERPQNDPGRVVAVAPDSDDDEARGGRGGGGGGESSEEEAPKKKLTKAQAAAAAKKPVKETAASRKKAAAAATTASKRSKVAFDSEEEDDGGDRKRGDSDEEEEEGNIPPPTKSRATASKAAPRAKASTPSRTSTPNAAAKSKTAQTKQVMNPKKNFSDDDDSFDEVRVAQSRGRNHRNDNLHSDEDDDDQVQILPSSSRAKVPTSVPTPKPRSVPKTSKSSEKKSSASSSSRGRMGELEDIDEDEDDVCHQPPIGGRNRETSFTSAASTSASSSNMRARNEEKDPFGSAPEGPPLTGRSATSAMGDSQARNVQASIRPAGKRQLPLSFSQNPDTVNKKKGSDWQ